MIGGSRFALPRGLDVVVAVRSKLVAERSIREPAECRATFADDQRARNMAVELTSPSVIPA